MDDQLQSRVLAPRRLDAALVARWDALLAASPALTSPFLSPHFARALEATGVKVRVCVLYRGGEAVGFLPFQYEGVLARLARAALPAGGVMTDSVGLVGAPGLRVEPARLMALAGLNTFSFSHLDTPQLGFGLTGGEGRIGLRLRLDPVDPLGALLRPQHRYLKDSERCARLIERDLGPLAFAFDQPDNRSALLDQLIEHKRAQYARTGAADSLREPWTRALLHRLAALDAPSCRAMLSTLHAGDTWVASHFGLSCNGVLHHWMPVYNPEFSKYAPGRLLMHQMIAACPGAGLHTIDHGEGDSPNKRQLANEEHVFLRGAWHGKSVLRFVGRGYQSIKWRLEG